MRIIAALTVLAASTCTHENSGTATTPAATIPSGHRTCSYVVTTDGMTVRATPGEPDGASFSGPDATEVLQSCLDALPEGGRIVVRRGTYVVSNVTVRSPFITLEGEGWGTILEGVEDALRLDLPPGLSTLDGVSIRNLQLRGGSGDGITNMHATSSFGTGTDTAINFLLMEGVRFTGFRGGACAVRLRNPDNKLVIRRNWFQSITGTDVYLESNGRDGGQIVIEQNSFIHGAPEGVLHLRTYLRNLRRVNVLHNNVVLSHGSGATAFRFERFKGALDHVNIAGNSIEDARVAVDIGGAGTLAVSDVNLTDNSFFYRVDPAEPGARGVMLRDVSARVEVRSNRFEAVSQQGWIAVEDQASASIHENVFSSAVVPVLGTPTTRIRGNIGLRTENAGRITVPAAAPAVLVPHGLASPPRLEDISITPAGTLGATLRYWVADANQSTFMLHVDTPPGPPGALFTWRIAAP